MDPKYILKYTINSQCALTSPKSENIKPLPVYWWSSLLRYGTRGLTLPYVIECHGILCNVTLQQEPIPFFFDKSILNPFYFFKYIFLFLNFFILSDFFPEDLKYI